MVTCQRGKWNTNDLHLMTYCVRRRGLLGIVNDDLIEVCRDLGALVPVERISAHADHVLPRIKQFSQ